MSARPIDVVLERLVQHRVHSNGRNRWRACCPGHGGSNRNALSIGIGADDAVLLRCFSGCDIDQVVGALGLDLSDLFPARQSPGAGASKPRRIGLLTAGQALELLHSETQLIWVAGNNLANGHELTAVDLARLNVAMRRIAHIAREVTQ
jgi:hypothetical protein